MQTNVQAALIRAHSYFKMTEARDVAVRAQLARERAEIDAKTARLRALRLAKEEQARAGRAAARLS